MRPGSKAPVEPPRWSAERLTADLERAVEAFRGERRREPQETYLESFAECRALFEELLERTGDLCELPARAAAVAGDKRLREALRYLAAVPVSEDDLATLVGAPLGASRLRADEGLARRCVETVLGVLDTRRFPWMDPADRRIPLDSERETALVASATLLAVRRVETARRMAGVELESSAKAALVAAGFTEVPPRGVANLDRAPAAGELCGECKLGTRKADLLVRLWDGRVMPIECKVSNSELNSIKRLNNDAAAKAKTWIEEFGTRSAVPTALLSGVFALDKLEDAQARGLTIFWAHGLDELVTWIATTR